jgi:hypothetical protein
MALTPPCFLCNWPFEMPKNHCDPLDLICAVALIPLVYDELSICVGTTSFAV